MAAVQVDHTPQDCVLKGAPSSRRRVLLLSPLMKDHSANPNPAKGSQLNHRKPLKSICPNKKFQPDRSLVQKYSPVAKNLVNDQVKKLDEESTKPPKAKRSLVSPPTKDHSANPNPAKCPQPNHQKPLKSICPNKKFQADRSLVQKSPVTKNLVNHQVKKLGQESTKPGLRRHSSSHSSASKGNRRVQEHLFYAGFSFGIASPPPSALPMPSFLA